MTEITLAELISKAEQKLLDLRYSENAMSYYRRHFGKIADFFALHGKTHFCMDTAMKWLDDLCDFSNKDKRKELSQHDVHRLRAVKTLNSVLHGEEIPVQYTRKIPEFSCAEMMNILKRFTEFTESYGYAKTTGHSLRLSCTELFNFLSRSSISPSAITPPILSDYFNTWNGCTKRTIETKMGYLKIVLKFLCTDGVVKEDFSGSLPKVRAPRLTALPSVWSIDDVSKLLAAIDRNNPTGKRDYAILLLAFRLGIRGCDIKRLKIENFDFMNKKELVFVQSKTSNPVVLPLLPDVGWAVINYLKDGRPRSESPFVFLKHVAPFEPFTENNHMYSIMKKYLRRAGIKIDYDRKYGIHSLRHTLATSLLEQSVDLKDISNLLGHERPDTTNIYIKKGISFLRQCALDVDFMEDAANA